MPQPSELDMSRRGWRDVGLLLADLIANHGQAVWRAALLSFLVALAEGFGILTLVPVLAFAISPEASAGVPLIDAAFAGLPASARLAAALAAFVLLMGLRSLLIYGRGRAQISLDAAYQAGLRLRATATLAARGWRFAAAIGQPGMQASLHNDIPRATFAVQYSIQLMVALLLILVQATLAALLSWKMTLAALVLAALGAPLGWWFVRRAQRSGRSISTRLEQSSRSGMRLHSELKAAMAQSSVGRFLADYRTSLSRLADELRRYGRDQAAATALFGLLAAVSAALLVWTAMAALGLSVPLSIGLLLLFARMNGPAQALFQSANNLAAYAPSFATLVARLGPLVGAPASNGMPSQPLEWGLLELKGVGLQVGGESLLESVDLRLEAGQWLAVEGPSGAGKTSLIDLIAGLFQPSSGSVEADGVRLDGETLRRWQSSIAYVGQDEMIFDSSLRDNLYAGVGEVAPALLEQALSVSGLDRLIDSWPEGLDLPLADRGSRLSGGERNRVGIARALLRQPRLLILDEATSALDIEAEAALLERLGKLEPRPALLLVSHRPQTLALCDRRIALSGKPSLVSPGSPLLA